MPEAGHGAEARVIDHIRSTAADQVRLLRRLVQIPSVSGDEREVQRVLLQALSGLGLEAEFQYTDDATMARALPNNTDRRMVDRPNLVATLRGTGGGRSLLLNGHVDVVRADSGHWTYPPFSAEFVDGRVWGRGAADMKGGIVAAVFALAAVHASGVSLRGDVRLAATVGEETGGVGTVAYLLANTPTDAAIVVEPTGLEVAIAQAGSLHCTIEVDGRAAHAAFRHLGVSAIDKMNALIAHLAEYEKVRDAEALHPLYQGTPNKVNVNVGTYRADGWTSTVPDRAVISVRLGVLPGEDATEVKAAFEQGLRDWSRRDAWLTKHPPRVVWAGAQFDAASTSEDEEIVGVLSRAGRDASGEMPLAVGLTAATDMVHIRRIWGIPAVLFGPGDGTEAHASNESIAVDDVRIAAEALALVVLRWCG